MDCANCKCELLPGQDYNYTETGPGVVQDRLCGVCYQKYIYQSNYCSYCCRIYKDIRPHYRTPTHYRSLKKYEPIELTLDEAGFFYQRKKVWSSTRVGRARQVKVTKITTPFFLLI